MKKLYIVLLIFFVIFLLMCQEIIVIWDSLNNRELAGFAWILIILIIIMSNVGDRNNFMPVIKALFEKRIIIVILVMLAWITMETYGLWYLGLWHKGMILNVVFWSFGVGFISIINSLPRNKGKDYLKRLIVDNIKFIIIIEFIVGAYVFPFWAEFILLPFAFIFTWISIMGKDEKVKKLANWIIGLAGIVLLYNSSVNMVDDWWNFSKNSNMLKFTMPVFLVIGYIPFLFLLKQYSNWEEARKQQ